MLDFKITGAGASSREEGPRDCGISDFSLETSDKRSIRVIKTLLVQQSGKIESPWPRAQIHDA